MSKYLYLFICSLILSIIVVSILSVVSPNNKGFNRNIQKIIILFTLMVIVIFSTFLLFDRYCMQKYISTYRKEDVRRLYNSLWANGVS